MAKILACPDCHGRPDCPTCGGRGRVAVVTEVQRILTLWPYEVEIVSAALAILEHRLDEPWPANVDARVALAKRLTEVRDLRERVRQLLMI